ncbi:hypothetical protein Bbelb_026120 [Branchiostoma belcheri]|nr:hypothetical protein Bbelb_026120 [Branchiostoma belcheri]
MAAASLSSGMVGGRRPSSVPGTGGRRPSTVSGTGGRRPSSVPGTGGRRPSTVSGTGGRRPSSVPGTGGRRPSSVPGTGGRRPSTAFHIDSARWRTSIAEDEYEHRASENVLHLPRSLAIVLTSCHEVLAAVRSFLTPLLRDSRGLPLFLVPWGFHSTLSATKQEAYSEIEAGVIKVSRLLPQSHKTVLSVGHNAPYVLLRAVYVQKRGQTQGIRACTGDARAPYVPYERRRCEYGLLTNAFIVLRFVSGARILLSVAKTPSAANRRLRRHITRVAQRKNNADAQQDCEGGYNGQGNSPRPHDHLCIIRGASLNISPEQHRISARLVPQNAMFVVMGTAKYKQHLPALLATWSQLLI